MKPIQTLGSQFRRLTIGMFVLLLPAFAFAALAPQIVASHDHTLLLKANGDVWAWGKNDAGQLGDGSKTARASPALIGRDFRVIATNSGHSAGIKADGSLWTWGVNRRRELGDGSRSEHLVPVQIGAGYRAVAVGESFTVAVRDDGSLWSWGRNGDGQLGDGTTVARSVPVQIGSGFVSVAAGENHAVALKADGTAWAWGDNEFGQLGDGSTVASTIPVRVGGQFASVVAGYMHTMALDSEGMLWMWGSGHFLQLPTAPSLDRCREVFSCAIRPRKSDKRVSMMTAGGERHIAALAVDGGRVLSWGRGFVSPPTSDLAIDADAAPDPGGDFVAIAAGDAHLVALKSDGSVWSWGDNHFGQLGNGQIGAGESKLVRVSVPHGEPVILATAATAPAAPADASSTKWSGRDWLRKSPEQLKNSGTTIELTRTACYGSCPVYKLTIRGDGAVLFHPLDVKKRDVRAALDPDKVSALLAAFRDIDFFALGGDVPAYSPNCPSLVMDAPSAHTSIRFGKFSKTMAHYYGCGDTKILRRLSAFEQSIDTIAGTEEYLNISEAIARGPMVPPSPARRAHLGD